MKINDRVKTNKNGLYGEGIILEVKTINYFGKLLTLYKVESETFGTEWINKIYLKKVIV